ncbi:MAG: hypothetical protein PHP50_09830 [Lachnospiraceae bacterium]|nr:hypothetical protein [Lachnospiraceae bacterium]
MEITMPIFSDKRFLELMMQLSSDFGNAFILLLKGKETGWILILVMILIFMECRLLFASLAVYTFMADGRKKYLGRLFLRKKKDGYEIKFPRRYVECAETTKYQLGCSSFFRKRHQYEEILVCCEKQKVAVEMRSNLIFYL